MPESRFIKTVAFGGYDKNDVNKKLSSLYQQIYDLKNDLRETKLTVENYKKGSDEEKAHESVLGQERAKLTELQVKNKNVSEKLKQYENEISQKDSKLKELEEKNASLEKALRDIRNEIDAMQAGDDPIALSTVFMEAKKSADLIKSSAKEKAAATEEKARKISENIINDANNTAAQIIYEAEVKAAETEAAALNNAEQIKVSSENLRAKMIEDTTKIYTQISNLKKAFEVFAEKGYYMLEDSENLLRKTEEELKGGEIPVFKVPQHIEPEYPEAPVLTPVEYNYETEEETEIPAETTEQIISDSMKKLQDIADSMKNIEPEQETAEQEPEQAEVQETIQVAEPAEIPEESEQEPPKNTESQTVSTEENNKKSSSLSLDELMKASLNL